MSEVPPVTDQALETTGAAIVARRIDHVGVIVADLDTATSSFAHELGLTDDGTWDDPDGRFRLRYLAVGDTTLQLVQPLAPGPLQEALDARGEGLHHVCFMVDDLDRAIDAVAGRIVSPAYASGRGARVCFLTRRTHGVTVELTEAAG